MRALAARRAGGCGRHRVRNAWRVTRVSRESDALVHPTCNYRLLSDVDDRLPSMFLLLRLRLFPEFLVPVNWLVRERPRGVVLGVGVCLLST